MRPLLMIPGPIEISDAVREAAATPPPSHLGPDLVRAYGQVLGWMRDVFRSDPGSQPFVLAGGGTLAMEMAVRNLVAHADRVLVVSTGWFSDRMAEMLRRAGAEVSELKAPVGEAPSPAEVEALLAEAWKNNHPFRLVTVTHVDTSTGVRADVEGILRAAAEQNVLSVVDGVCALGGERTEMAAWRADVVLTASQKALGAPPGLAVLVASERALARREALRRPVPMTLDWHEWRDILTGYEQGAPGYFSTPPTSLILGLHAAMREILERDEDPAEAMRRRWRAHARCGRAMRAAWAALGLHLVPKTNAIAAHTLSALHLPEKIGPELPKRVAARGVIVAGGLHPAIRSRSFRVGHMGVVTERPEALRRTIRAVAESLIELGHRCSVEDGLAAFEHAWDGGRV